MRSRIEPITQPEDSPLTGLVLITQDQESIAAEVAQTLAQKGTPTAIISHSTLAKPKQLAQEVEALRQRYGRIQGIIHLASLTTIPIPDNLFDWRHWSQIQSKSLFHLLQICADDLRQSQGRVLVSSCLGGEFGRNGHWGAGLPLSGSSSGLLKTMMLEWSSVKAKVVDFDQISSSNLVYIITQEFSCQYNCPEIGYVQGNRIAFDIDPDPRGREGLYRDVPWHVWEADSSADWVVLSIGGARGITAEIVEELLIPGMTLILVGRSPMSGEESDQTKGIDDMSQLRRFFTEQARRQGVSPTPVQIDNQIKQLQRQRESRQNLEKFRRIGVKVEYHAIDVRREAEFGTLIEGIYQRYGRLDAVLQGAGIIEDKLLVDKQPDSFDRVFNTKVDSTFILSRYLRPDSLKLVVLFASVAGRTGNRGQCDYAAANEVVNRFAWWMEHQWLNTRVVAINWGPWDVTGMASDAVKRQFRERGVIPIPPDAGRQFFRDELRYGNRGEAELIVGFFEEVSQQPEKSKENNETLTAKQPSFPLLPSLPQIQPNSTVSLDKTITLVSDPYLGDHRLDGKPVVPAAVALELMAEFVQAAWSDWIVCEVHDLRVLRGIVLDSEAGKSVRLTARGSTHGEAQSLDVVAEILDADQQKPFYRATLRLRPQLAQASDVPQISPLNTHSGIEVAKAYRDCCFHGPCFQLITAIDRFSQQGADFHVTPSHPASWLKSQPTTWLFDPGLIDTTLQMALIWTRIHGDRGALPSRFGHLIRYAVTPVDAQLRALLRVKHFDSTTMIFDALVVDQNNHIYLELKDMENTCSRALKRLTSGT